MSRFCLQIVALALVLSSADGWAFDKNGRFTSEDNETSRYYLDANSRTTLKGDIIKGPSKSWLVSG